MIKNYLLLLLTNLYAFVVLAQSYTTANIHSHNDYANSIPFLFAYTNEVGSIEADIFLRDGELYVAHSSNEIELNKTLDILYLQPLYQKIKSNNRMVYNDSVKKLNLLIDLKTNGESTLPVLIDKLNKYPEIVTCSSLKITISGNLPDIKNWDRFPMYIFFDGNPEVNYDDKNLARIGMFSSDFKKYSVWNGKGNLLATDKASIAEVIQNAHNKHKSFRFWATPDVVNAWITFINLGVDYIGTDHVGDLSRFIKSMPQSSFKNTQTYRAYQPKQRAKDVALKHVILLIGDGMGLAQQYAAYTANGGELNLFNIKSIGFSVTPSSDSYITDSAGGGTAMATGKKTNNRFVGVDSLGNSLNSLPEILFAKGWKSAVISAGDITDATPAAFYAHQTEREWNEAVAADFLQSHVNILIGGGVDHFIHRKDGKDLKKTLNGRGYTFLTHWASIDTITKTNFLLLDNDAVVSKKNGRGNFLLKSLNKTCELLGANDQHFFVMAEGAQIDYGGHANDLETVVREMLDFDQAVGEAMKYADNNPGTLLIVTADHETGGLSLLDGSFNEHRVSGNFSTNDHTAVMVPVYAYGDGASLFQGVYQNTDIFHKILSAIQVKP